MFRKTNAFAGLILAVLLLAHPSLLAAKELSGVIVGRTGEIIHVNLPQPVKVGTMFKVKLMKSESPVAEAEVISCTTERPYIALAKIIHGDMRSAVPIGVRAYTRADSVIGPPDFPRHKPFDVGSDRNRFSLQAGAYYPSQPILRDTIAEYWQAYRLDYAFMRTGRFETIISAEYNKGSSELVSGDGIEKRTMEIIPLTMMARYKPFEIGSAKFFIGAGAGIYRVQTSANINGAPNSDRTDEFGHEFSLGMEFTRDWVLELRYRDVPNTNIEGYSLALGVRF